MCGFGNVPTIALAFRNSMYCNLFSTLITNGVRFIFWDVKTINRFAKLGSIYLYYGRLKVYTSCLNKNTYRFGI
jgi:hypothetical protein